MVDRVVLGRLVVVVGDSVSATASAKCVRPVPVYGYPATQLVLAWLPDARSAASRLTATAQAVTERRTPRYPALASTDPRVLPRQR